MTLLHVAVLAINIHSAYTGSPWPAAMFSAFSSDIPHSLLARYVRRSPSLSLHVHGRVAWRALTLGIRCSDTNAVSRLLSSRRRCYRAALCLFFYLSRTPRLILTPSRIRCAAFTPGLSQTTSPYHRAAHLHHILVPPCPHAHPDSSCSSPAMRWPLAPALHTSCLFFIGGIRLRRSDNVHTR